MSVWLLAGGCALACWPPRRSVARLRAQSTSHWARWRFRVPVAAVVVCGAAVFGLVLLGPVGGVVTGVLTGDAMRRWAARRGQRQQVAVLAEVADGLGGMAAELRAGNHPAVAADAVVADLPETAAGARTALRSVAAAARLGADVDAALTAATADAARAEHMVLTRVARAWRLARRYGLPLADVIDAVRCDIEATSRFAAQLSAKLAGPRASATILSALPLLGIALGEAMGASPVDVLASTASGQLLLAAGAALLLAGNAWCARLTTPEVLS